MRSLHLTPSLMEERKSINKIGKYIPFTALGASAKILSLSSLSKARSDGWGKVSLASDLKSSLPA